ncbi:hypothetical protein CEXT_518521 [Caerostris extrusa]|uniref:Uncharacterized protein n=1 Tax=Caerostris extrusa TaxID=172846 RepID=A0AAV4TXW2_CAEEX|nr:hypothetical protein CEXT_518521 [Caerostris extrusa]
MAQLGASVLKSQLDPSPTRQKLFTLLKWGRAPPPRARSADRSRKARCPPTHLFVLFAHRWSSGSQWELWLPGRPPFTPLPPFVPGASTGDASSPAKMPLTRFWGKKTPESLQKLHSPGLDGRMRVV